MSISTGNAFNENVYEVTDEVAGVPDRCVMVFRTASFLRQNDTLCRSV